MLLKWIRLELVSSCRDLDRKHRAFCSMFASSLSASINVSLVCIPITLFAKFEALTNKQRSKVKLAICSFSQ